MDLRKDGGVCVRGGSGAGQAGVLRASGGNISDGTAQTGFLQFAAARKQGASIVVEVLHNGTRTTVCEMCTVSK